MKRLITVLSTIAMMMILASCGGAGDGDAESGNDSAQNTGAETNFTVTISGAVEDSIEDSGFLSCSEEAVTLNGLPYLELSAGSFTGNRVQIRVPYNIEAGTYPLSGQDGMSADNPNYDLSPAEDTGKIVYSDADGNDWQFGEGTISLEAVPSADGEPVSGSFSATLTGEDAEGTVTVEGNFDYTASSSAFTDSDEDFANNFTEVPCD